MRVESKFIAFRSIFAAGDRFAFFVSFGDFNLVTRVFFLNFKVCHMPQGKTCTHRYVKQVDVVSRESTNRVAIQYFHVKVGNKGVGSNTTADLRGSHYFLYRIRIFSMTKSINSNESAKNL